MKHQLACKVIINLEKERWIKHTHPWGKGGGGESALGEEKEKNEGFIEEKQEKIDQMGNLLEDKMISEKTCLTTKQKG